MWDERTKRLLTTHYTQLQKAKILLIGLGGVGAIAAELLIRSGITNLTIIDADNYEITNLNRQLNALHSTLKQSKVEVTKQRLLEINPQANITAKKLFITAENISSILSTDYDYLIDAIDTLQPKVALLATAYHNNIPTVSAMGAGGKLDPMKVLVTDISKSYNCMLAKNVRKRLHHLGIKKGIKVVFSSELVDKKLVETTDGSGNKKSIVGTISYMPNLFGLLCCSTVINDLIKKEQSADCS